MSEAQICGHFLFRYSSRRRQVLSISMAYTVSMQATVWEGVLSSMGVHAKHSCLPVTQLANRLKFQHKTSSCWSGNDEKCIWGSKFLMTIVINNLILKHVSWCISYQEGLLICWTFCLPGWGEWWQLPLNASRKATPVKGKAARKYRKGQKNANSLSVALTGTARSMGSCVLPSYLSQYCS